MTKKWDRFSLEERWHKQRQWGRKKWVMETDIKCVLIHVWACFYCFPGISSIVKSSSITQSIKGIATAGKKYYILCTVYCVCVYATARWMVYLKIERGNWSNWCILKTTCLTRPPKLSVYHILFDYSTHNLDYKKNDWGDIRELCYTC